MQRNMVSVNKVILIGNLGRVSRGALDMEGREAVDRYLMALWGFSDAIGAPVNGSLAKAAQKLAEALRQLRQRVIAVVIPKKMTGSVATLSGRTAAFFHAGKADARNLP